MDVRTPNFNSGSGEPYVFFADAGQDLGEFPNAAFVKSVTPLRQACERLKRGSVVLPFGQETGFKSLARLISLLRQELPLSVRIFVREIDKRMRMRQVSILTKLGMTQLLPRTEQALVLRAQLLAWEGREVIYKGTPPVEKLIEFSRGGIPLDFIKSSDFIARVKRYGQNNIFALPSCMVVLYPSSTELRTAICDGLQTAVRDAIACDAATFSLLPGDSQEGLWLYLNDCGETDVETVLWRALGEENKFLLKSWRIVSQRSEILQLLEQLGQEQALID